MVEVLDPETAFECDRTWRSRSGPSMLTLTGHFTGVDKNRVDVTGKVRDQRKGIEMWGVDIGADLQWQKARPL